MATAKKRGARCACGGTIIVRHMQGNQELGLTTGVTSFGAAAACSSCGRTSRAVAADPYTAEERARAGLCRA